MDTDEGMMMVWICVEEYWIGLKIIDIYEWIQEIFGISCIDMKEHCACKIIVKYEICLKNSYFFMRIFTFVLEVFLPRKWLQKYVFHTHTRYVFQT